MSHVKEINIKVPILLIIVYEMFKMSKVFLILFVFVPCLIIKVSMNVL